MSVVSTISIPSIFDSHSGLGWVQCERPSNEIPFEALRGNEWGKNFYSRADK
jgi:hypothetical protein